MTFPGWVQKARSKKAQASARLRYIMYKLAIEHTPTGSIRGLCETCKLGSHTTVSLYISQGAFSQHLAERFEERFGSAIITAAQLVAPLDIPTEAKPSK